MVRQEMLPIGLVGTKADNGFGRLEVELLPVITKSSFSSMELEERWLDVWGHGYSEGCECRVQDGNTWRV